MKWSLNDVPAFVAVVEQNGITAAAKRLGLPKSTVSQAVSRLEAALGVRLFERNSRAVRITEEGQAFYDKAPPAFTQEYLAPRIMEFKRAHPNVDLELRSTVHRVDFFSDGVDLAIVVGAQDDSELFVKKLRPGRLIWIASPGYAAGVAQEGGPEELQAHLRVCETRYARRDFPVRANGRVSQLDLFTGVVRLSDPLAARAAVLAGAGVSPMPELYCRNLIAEGRLVEVFRGIEADHGASSLSAVYPSRRLTSPRIRAFLGFLDRINP